MLPRHTNIMRDKGFNLFDECASSCVYMSPQEEECTNSSRGDSKMDTPDSIESSQRMLTEINESGAIAKNEFQWKVILSNI